MFVFFLILLVVVSVLAALGVAAYYWGYNARHEAWTDCCGYDPRYDWH